QHVKPDVNSGLHRLSTSARINAGVPLLVLVAKTDHHKITLLDQGACANGIHLGGLVITPELVIGLTQVIASSIASRVIRYRRGKDHIQSSGLGTALDLLAPISVDLTGKIDIKTHDCNLLKRI